MPQREAVARHRLPTMICGASGVSADDSFKTRGLFKNCTLRRRRSVRRRRSECTRPGAYRARRLFHLVRRQFRFGVEASATCSRHVSAIRGFSVQFWTIVYDPMNGSRTPAEPLGMSGTNQLKMERGWHAPQIGSKPALTVVPQSEGTAKRSVHTRAATTIRIPATTPSASGTLSPLKWESGASR